MRDATQQSGQPSKDVATGETRVAKKLVSPFVLHPTSKGRPRQASPLPLGPTDDALCFVMAVRHDLGLAEAALRRLREHYPEATVIVRSDGDPNPQIREVAIRHNCVWDYGGHLYAVFQRGRIVAEFLRLGLRYPAPYIFKIDTDTRFDRRFRALPMLGSCVFGTVQGSGSPNEYSIQGGCIGITRLAAEQLLSSGILDASELDSPRDTWARSDVCRLRAEEAGLASFDWILGWACDQLGIPLIDWAEICSWWLKTPPNPGLRYAVIHPDRTMATNLTNPSTG